VRLRRLSHFLFEWPKRKATPLTRFAGVLPAKSAGGLRGLSTTHLVLTPNWLASCRPPCGLLLHPPAAAEGPRVEQRAFLRVLFRKARSKTKLERSHGRAMLRSCCRFLSISAFHRVRATMARCSTGAPVRQAGCSFSLVTFSLSTQRESDSGAKGARTLFASNPPTRARASPASGLLQKRWDARRNIYKSNA
jgi:hypothetical protein